jgi:hypothetical protein
MYACPKLKLETLQTAHIKIVNSCCRSSVMLNKAVSGHHFDDGRVSVVQGFPELTLIPDY